MKLLSFVNQGRETWGAVVGDGVVDLGKKYPQYASLADYIASGAFLRNLRAARQAYQERRDLLLAILDDQVGLHIQVTFGARSGRAQAALIQLIGNGLANPLFGQVALDPWIVGAVLQGGFFPAPTAVGAKVPAGVEVMVDLVGGTGTEQGGTYQ